MLQWKLIEPSLAAGPFTFLHKSENKMFVSTEVIKCHIAIML